MKKIVSIALALVMMAALPVLGSAAAVSKDDFAWNSGENWYTFNDDGTITMGYEGVNFALLGLTLKDAKYTEGGSYTVELKTQLSEAEVGTGAYGSALALNTRMPAGEDAVYGTAGFLIKVVDYSKHTGIGLGTDANIGTAIEMFDYTTGAAVPVEVNTGASYADMNIVNGEGKYNTVKAVVTNNKLDVYVNGVKVLEGYDISASKANSLITFGSMGNPSDLSKRQANFKDIVVADANNKVTYSTSAEYAVGDTYGSAGTGSSNPGSNPGSNPDTSDADIIMYAGMAFALMTAVVASVIVRKKSSAR